MCRLVTLVGLGGSGKTDLALAAARQLLAQETTLREPPFPDGVYFVPLHGEHTDTDTGTGTGTPLGQPRAIAAGVAAAIAQAAGLQIGTADHANHAGDLPALVGQQLRSKRILLIVDGMDNHLLGAGALATLLQRAPGAKLLVTSRTRLRVPGETVCEVRGLALPTDADDLDRSDAGTLFLQQASRVRPDALYEPAERAAAAEVCRLVDGLPAALLYAADYLRGMACVDIAADLASGQELPVRPGGPGGPGDAVNEYEYASRHRSPKAILDAASAQLAVAERIALIRLAVFRGSFTRGAAAAVAGAAAAHLVPLVEAGLLNQSGGTYTMSALVRCYAAARLAADPDEAAAVAARHAAFWADRTAARAATVATVATIAQHRYVTAEHTGQPLAGEFDDLRAAWEWATTHRETRVLGLLRPEVTRMTRCCDLAGDSAEGTRQLGLAVDRLGAMSTVPRLRPAPVLLRLTSRSSD